MPSFLSLKGSNILIVAGIIALLCGGLLIPSLFSSDQNDLNLKDMRSVEVCAITEGSAPSSLKFDQYGHGSKPREIVEFVPTPHGLCAQVSALAPSGMLTTVALHQKDGATKIDKLQLHTISEENQLLVTDLFARKDNSYAFSVVPTDPENPTVILTDSCKAVHRPLLNPTLQPGARDSLRVAGAFC